MFNTCINNITYICNVLDYSPYKPYIVTGSGFGDADLPEDETFEFELLDKNSNSIDVELTEEDINKIKEEFLIYNADEYYNNY